MGRPAGYRHRYRPVKPYRHPGSDDLRLVIYMDDDTFREIDAAAKKNDCSVSSQARLFIDIGIETMAIELQEPLP